MKNKSLEIAVNHLSLAKSELDKCAQELYRKLEQLSQLVHAGEPIDHQILIDAISTLQLQDIISQRLDKVSDFLQLVDNKVDMQASQSYLDEFAWEKEVNQDEIDSMFNDYKG